MRDPGLNSWTYYLPPDDPADVAPAEPADALTAPDIEDLLPAGLALWPRGAAWGSPDGLAPPTTSVLAGFTRALLGPLAEMYGHAWGVLRQNWARLADTSLPDWEADYGLPNPCSAPDATTASRKADLMVKVRSTATITPQDFVRLARDAGYEIAIEEPAMFECGFSECGGQHTVGDIRQEVYWIVHILNISVDYFRVSESECGYDPLFSTGDIERLRCLFRDLYPGWSEPVYQIDEMPLSLSGLPIVLEGPPVTFGD